MQIKEVSLNVSTTVNQYECVRHWLKMHRHQRVLLGWDRFDNLKSLRTQLYLVKINHVVCAHHEVEVRAETETEREDFKRF